MHTVCSVVTVFVYLLYYKLTYSSDPRNNDFRAGEKNKSQSFVLTVAKKVSSKLDLLSEVFFSVRFKKDLQFYPVPNNIKTVKA